MHTFKRHLPALSRAALMLAGAAVFGWAAFWLFGTVPWATQADAVWQAGRVIVITCLVFIAIGSNHPLLDAVTAAAILSIPAMFVSLVMLVVIAGFGLALIGLQLIGLVVLPLVAVGFLAAIPPSGWQDWLFGRSIAET